MRPTLFQHLITTAIAFASVAASGCSVGAGTGSARGHVVFDGCALDNPNYDLRPDFFSSDFIEDLSKETPGLRRAVNMRIQRGSFREGQSDGLLFYIADVDRIKRELIGQPIAINDDPNNLVRGSIYLKETCVAGFPQRFHETPAVLEALSGTITFSSIYAPDVASEEVEFIADFDIHYGDRQRPTTRYADIVGRFQFFHQRGQPAQRVP